MLMMPPITEYQLVRSGDYFVYDKGGTRNKNT